jgi:hypothetical protein
MLKMIWLKDVHGNFIKEGKQLEKFNLKKEWSDVDVRGVISFMNDYADSFMFEKEDFGTFEEVFGFAYTSTGQYGSLQTSLNENYTEHVPELGDKEITLNSLLLTESGIVFGIWWDEKEKAYYSRFN